MNRDKGILLGWAGLACGVLSFCILLPGAFWWVGFVFGAAAIFLGWKGMRNPAKRVQVLALAGIGLALVFTLVYLGRALL